MHFYWLKLTETNAISEGKEKTMDYAAAAKQSAQDTGAKATEKARGKN